MYFKIYLCLAYPMFAYLTCNFMVLGLLKVLGLPRNYLSQTWRLGVSQYLLNLLARLIRQNNYYCSPESQSRTF